MVLIFPAKLALYHISSTKIVILYLGTTRTYFYGLSRARLLARPPANPFPVFCRFFCAAQLLPLRSSVSFLGAGGRVSFRRHAPVGGGGVFSAFTRRPRFVSNDGGAGEEKGTPVCCASRRSIVSHILPEYFTVRCIFPTTADVFLFSAVYGRP